jgi:hypothetical protein
LIGKNGKLIKHGTAKAMKPSDFEKDIESLIDGK